jgi:hypothetical protein
LHKTAPEAAPVSYAGRIPLVLLALAIFLFGAGITALVLRFGGGRNAGASPRKAPTTLGQTFLPQPPPGVPLPPAPDPALLEKAVGSLLAARGPDQLASIIRDSSQLPDGIAGKLAGLEAADGKVTSIRYWGPVQSRCLPLESVLVTFDSGRNRLALLSPDPAGTWRVDFDAFDRHVAPEWTTLLAGNPVEGTARVHVTRDNYFNGRYLDDREWACYGLASPDHDTLMFGYALQGSPQQRALDDSLRLNLQRSATGIQRLTLGIRHPGTGDAKQFEITRALSDDWALGGVALDRIAAPAAD